MVWALLCKKRDIPRGTGRAGMEVTVATSSVRFDMLPVQFAPWPVLLEEVRYLEEQGIGTVWLGDHYSWVPYLSLIHI